MKVEVEGEGGRESVLEGGGKGGNNTRKTPSSRGFIRTLNIKIVFISL